MLALPGFLPNAWLQTAQFVYREDETHMRVKGMVNEAMLLSYCKLSLVTIQAGLLNLPDEGRMGDQPLELIQIKVLQPGSSVLIGFLLGLTLANGDLVTHF